MNLVTAQGAEEVFVGEFTVLAEKNGVLSGPCLKKYVTAPMESLIT